MNAKGTPLLLNICTFLHSYLWKQSPFPLKCTILTSNTTEFNIFIKPLLCGLCFICTVEDVRLNLTWALSLQKYTDMYTEHTHTYHISYKHWNTNINSSIYTYIWWGKHYTIHTCINICVHSTCNEPIMRSYGISEHPCLTTSLRVYRKRRLFSMSPPSYKVICPHTQLYSVSSPLDKFENFRKLSSLE